MLGSPASRGMHPQQPPSDAGPLSPDGAVTPAGSAGSAAAPPRNDGLYTNASATKLFFTTTHMAQLVLRGQLQPMPRRMEHHTAVVEPAALSAVIPTPEDKAGFYTLQPEVESTRCPAGNFGGASQMLGQWLCAVLPGSPGPPAPTHGSGPVHSPDYPGRACHSRPSGAGPTLLGQTTLCIRGPSASIT